jgi:plasmid stabilization system protein ParE
MHRIVERPKALEDLDGIADYIAADNLEAARKVIGAVADTYRHLAEWPEMSQRLTRGYRMMPVVGFRQYLVLYICHDKTVEILRVIRADQDYQRILSTK